MLSKLVTEGNGPPSSELTIGSPELVQGTFGYRGISIGARALLDLISLAYPSGEERGNLLVQKNFYLPSWAQRNGGGGRHPVE
jgi:hypothetical protein